MPIISAFFGIIIRMYFDDHEPEHFHAEHEGQNAPLTSPVVLSPARSEERFGIILGNARIALITSSVRRKLLGEEIVATLMCEGALGVKGFSGRTNLKGDDLSNYIGKRA
ncbi:MAG TPA: DUF4160 domain-containing protein [Thermoanaerobaculia bacterium]